MEPLGERSWKEYYNLERLQNRDLIDSEIIKWWSLDDPTVDNIYRKGGALSFPHTYLSTSLIPVIRTVRTILRSGDKRILAMGVMHRISDFDPRIEFSLDNFKYVLERSGCVLGLETPKIIEYYFPRGSVDQKRPAQIIDSIREDIQFIPSECGKDTSIVLTGDLAHYGREYGSTVLHIEPEEKINRSIEEGLEQAYMKKDFKGYFEHSVETMNDQWAPAIATSILLGEGLTYEIISQIISDYSDVLQTKPPCLVASTFYGVYPHH
jgi:hypothetical protein